MNHFTVTLKRALISSIFLITNAVSSAQLPADTQQLIIGIAPSKNSSHVTLSMFEKAKAGWKQDGSDWKGRLGKNGLAWGIGLHPRNMEGAKKLAETMKTVIGFPPVYIIETSSVVAVGAGQGTVAMSYLYS